jgi:AraC-like DNA-binding protein
MEMRRLGTARKPMIVVQNATVGQFVESAKKLYPNAKVLTIEDKDHTGEGRKNFYAKIKYNDWDMIVVPQSVFERIPDSEERQMAYVKDKIEEKQVKSNDEALMERVMQAVNKHMDDSDFTAAQLATEVGLSRTHLQRKMKDITGLNVKEFVRNLRLEQAARMLREQKLNVSQVAYSVGFSNLAHFSTVFRKHFGVSPSEYVAQQK